MIRSVGRTIRWSACLLIVAGVAGRTAPVAAEPPYGVARGPVPSGAASPLRESTGASRPAPAPHYGLPLDRSMFAPPSAEPPPGDAASTYAAHGPAPPQLQGWKYEFPFLDFSHGDPNDAGRHVGLGEPLEGTSWLNRKWHVGWFVGAIHGDELIDDQVQQNAGLFGGYRVGYDFDHYWGAEGRWGFSNLELTDSTGSDRDRTSRDWFWDAQLLYYPWGDARWRPFVSAGLGWAEFRFVDHNQQDVKDTTVHLPIGVGVKYYYRKWLALRVDLMDNIAFGSEQVDSMHNLSLTGGVEIRLGGPRRSYFPWNPGATPW